MQVKQCSSESEWDEAVNQWAGHPLQLWGWGEVKAAHGWTAERYLVTDAGERVVGGVQVLVKRLPKPFHSLLYVPRGPFGEASQHGELIDTLVAQLRLHHQRAVQIVAEPDAKTMPGSGWKRSKNTILIPRTLILDLNKAEDELKAAMAKKTRQYINKSNREGLVLREVTTPEELEKCLVIYRETAQRSQFALHGDQYYYDVAQKMGASSRVFAAFQGDEPVAFLWNAVSSTTSFELYGGMNTEGQRVRANYALKWYAITECKAAGVQRYDMNGLLNDGINNFKQGFAAHENTLAGTYVHGLSPWAIVWEKLLPAVRSVLRTIKKRRI